MAETEAEKAAGGGINVEEPSSARLRAASAAAARSRAGSVDEGALRADGVWRRAVSGVFFLRFLVPGLLSPLACSIASEPPSEAASRTLVLVSKVRWLLTASDCF